jgi:hypothetical protein
VATRGQFEDEMQQEAKEWWVKEKSKTVHVLALLTIHGLLSTY